MNILVEYNWPDLWESVPPEQGARLAAQLNCEVKKGHPLFGVPVTCLARRGDNDDVLFSLKDGTAVAVVHLTYNTAEANPDYPHTSVYSDLEVWRQEDKAGGHRVL